MAALAASLVSVVFLQKGVARFLSGILPDLVSSPSMVGRCTGRFPGVSYQSLLGLVGTGSFGALDSEGWPSYYSMFMGFLTGWIGTLPVLYANEIAASPNRSKAITGGYITLGILLFSVMLYRIISGCEGFGSLSVGLLSGFFLGVAIVLAISWVTDRRATNLLGLPLIRSKSEDGKPIYVCERPEENETKK